MNLSAPKVMSNGSCVCLTSSSTFALEQFTQLPGLALQLLALVQSTCFQQLRFIIDIFPIGPLNFSFFSVYWCLYRLAPDSEDHLWAAHHRKYHRHSDTEKDVHSPNSRSFWSHTLWFMTDYSVPTF